MSTPETSLRGIDEPVKTCRQCGTQAPSHVAVCPRCTEILPELKLPNRLLSGDELPALIYKGEERYAPAKPAEVEDALVPEPPPEYEPEPFADVLIRVLKALAAIGVLWLLYALIGPRLPG